MPKIPTHLQEIPQTLSLDGRYKILVIETNREANVLVSEGQWSIVSLMHWQPLSSIQAAYRVLEFKYNE